MRLRASQRNRGMKWGSFRTEAVHESVRIDRTRMQRRRTAACGFATPMRTKPTSAPLRADDPPRLQNRRNKPNSSAARARIVSHQSQTRIVQIEPKFQKTLVNTCHFSTYNTSIVQDMNVSSAWTGSHRPGRHAIHQVCRARGAAPFTGTKQCER